MACGWYEWVVAKPTHAVILPVLCLRKPWLAAALDTTMSELLAEVEQEPA